SKPVVEFLQGRKHVEFKSDLHLATSVRSFRSENVSKLVKELLDLELDAARSTLQHVQERYPIALTRNLNAARRWLRQNARGSARHGRRRPAGRQRRSDEGPRLL